METKSPTETLLQSLAQQQAQTLLAGYVGAVVLGTPVPLAASAILATSRMLHEGRTLLDPPGRLGLANIITLVRLALTLALLAFPRTWLCPAGAFWLLLIFALDGLDGWVARTTGSSTKLGASLDQESDAVLVAVAAFSCWQAGLCGGWILAIGPLRWLYVLSLRIVPSSSEIPRSQFPRLAFGVLVTAFIGIFLAPQAWLTRGYLGAASLITAISFARSCWWTWGPKPAR